MSAFDLDGFRAVVEARDVERWTAFYDADAEWIEYRHADPPRAPNVMRGHDVIRRFVEGVAAAPLRIDTGNPVLDERRAAFTLTVTREDGRRIVENVILEHRDGLVTRQIDVEAWD